MKNLCSREQLSFILKVQDKHLTYLLYGKGINKCYHSFLIPKKNGEQRKIDAPNNELKQVQRRLGEALLDYQEKIWKEQDIEPRIANAFLRGKSIITNARVHRNRKYVLNMDLEDFFGSFHFGRVLGFFEKNKNFSMDKKVAIVMAQLTCYNGALPQGAPTSPIVSNLIFQIVDMRILELARKYRLDYTRYADDLTFSTNDKRFRNNKDEFITKMSSLLRKSGFSINEEKTRFLCYSSRQSVTGITVNEKLNVSHEYIKTTRAMAYSLYTKGKFYIHPGEEGTIDQLQGRLSFIDQLDLYNNRLDKDKHNWRCLNMREKEYQKFLFYRHFVSNEKPLIVTEGKTDIVHLRTALRHLEKHYPELINNKEGRFEYQIEFLNKTKKLKYFLDINPDGANTMKNIYNLYSGGHGYPNLFKLFYSNSNRYKNPVILLFDNETITKDKPLKQFIAHAKLTKEQENEFLEKLYLQLIPESNLYLVTLPLPQNKKECEIEDLYDDSAFPIIEGKHFDRKAGSEDEEHYGKEVFAHYISKHDNVSYAGFKSLFDVFVEVCK